MLSRIGMEPVRDKLISYALHWNAFLDGLNERYGGWDGYITSPDGLGFSKEDLEIIRTNMRS
jgi:hypothetical protein